MFVFIFCLLDLLCTTLFPKYMQPPVWIFKSGCTPYAASTHVQNWLRLSAPIILLSSMVFFRYCNTHLNFSLFSLVLLVTLVHRKNMARSMSGLPLFATHSNFKLWNEICLHLSFLVLWNSHLRSADPYFMAMMNSCLSIIRTNKLIPQCNTS